MSNTLMIAKKQFLERAELSENDLARLMNSMLSRSIDAADFYFQQNFHESWILEDGIVKDAGFGADSGVGIRAISGERTGFAYSDEIQLAALSQAANAAQTIARLGGAKASLPWKKSEITERYISHNPLAEISAQDKIDLLKKIDVLARQENSAITHVTASLAGSYDVVLVVASDGTFAADIRPLIRLNVSVIAEKNGVRERASAGGGGRVDFHYFLKENRGADYAREAVRQALINLEAKPAPAGPMPVVLGSGWPGILLHEAVGHGLEGDFNRKGTSAFSNRMGQLVASPLCTVVDDGTIADRRGSLNMDDEGTPTQRTVLIENGRLAGYLLDKLNAKLMGMSPTGNGRRESYAHLPMPRMTNTFMLPGESTPEEIIASIKNGIYAVNFGGGQVDITSGKFVFSASEAYLIKNGKILHPVKGATLIGSGPEVMQKISMVGNDLALDPGVGVCGKDGQSVPVGVGQPTLKIDEITVGGTQI